MFSGWEPGKRFSTQERKEIARWPIQFRQEATSRAAPTNAQTAATTSRFPQRRIYRHARSAATANTRRFRAAIAETIPIRTGSNLAALTCEECGREAETVGEALRWRAYQTAADEEEGEGKGVAVYCPDCAQREFESGD
jgi:hypothetical protein